MYNIKSKGIEGKDFAFLTLVATCLVPLARVIVGKRELPEMWLKALESRTWGPRREDWLK